MCSLKALALDIWKLIPILLPIVAPIAAGAAGSIVPTLPVETLSEKHITVPEDLPNLPHLFIVGFTKDSRSQTTQWSRLVQDKSLPGALAIYGVSVIEDVPKLLRGFVVGGIRRGIPKRLHDRFLLVSEQSAAWKALVSYSEPDAAYLVLTNSNQEVVWRTHGAASKAKVRELDEQVSAISQHEQHPVTDATP